MINSITSNINKNYQPNSRLYLEAQLKSTEQRLRTAGEKLAKFQLDNKAISLPDQMQSSIQQVGELKGKIVAKQYESALCYKP